MRTRSKARLEAELAAAASAKQQQTLLQDDATQIKDSVVHKSPSPEHLPELSSESIIESKETVPCSDNEHPYLEEQLQPSESEVEEEISDVDEHNVDAINETEKSELSDQQGSNNGGTDLLLLDSKSTRSAKSLPKVSGGYVSHLQPDIDRTLYFDFDDVMMGGSGSSRTIGRHSDPDKELMKKSVLPPDLEKKDTAPLIYQSLSSLQKMKKAERKKSAGSQWFDMPATEITPELKNDLKLLRMRNALDPSRHYKANDSKQLPRYFQVGRVIEGPTDFYSGRIPRRQQKQTLVDELIANEDFRKYHKKKYLELQTKFSSGTKRHKNVKHRKKYKK